MLQVQPSIRGQAPKDHIESEPFLLLVHMCVCDILFVIPLNSTVSGEANARRY